MRGVLGDDSKIMTVANRVTLLKSNFKVLDCLSGKQILEQLKGTDPYFIDSSEPKEEGLPSIDDRGIIFYCVV